MTSPRHDKLLSDLAELKLYRIAELFPEVLNEAARNGSSMLDVLATLIGEEVVARRQRALAHRIKHPPAPTQDTARIRLHVP